MSNFTFLALHLPALRADAQEAERIARVTDQRSPGDLGSRACEHCRDALD
jgi:hypothetical protein